MGWSYYFAFGCCIWGLLDDEIHKSFLEEENYFIYDVILKFKFQGLRVETKKPASYFDILKGKWDAETCRYVGVWDKNVWMNLRCWVQRKLRHDSSLFLLVYDWEVSTLIDYRVIFLISYRKSIIFVLSNVTRIAKLYDTKDLEFQLSTRSGYIIIRFI